jgi:hypothetical protein
MNEPLHTESVDLLLGQLVERLADAVATRLADILAERQPARLDDQPSRKLLTLDQFVALLPAGKTPQTWKAWLYQRTRLSQVPGCHKLGGRLFFDPDRALAWLLAGATSGEPAAGLDLPGNQSLHAQAVAHEPTHRPRRADRS